MKLFLSLLFSLSIVAAFGQKKSGSPADSAFDAFNTYFYNTGTELYYNTTDKSGTGSIWTQAIFWDIAMHAWERNKKPGYRKLIDDIYEGAYNRYDGYNWNNTKEWFIYDDMMWWVIALARAHQLTGDDRFLKNSISGFDRVWQGYDSVSGGMFWQFNHTSKHACINYPTVIAALRLYQITKNKTYLEKAKNVYEWSQAHLFFNGRVADRVNKQGANPGFEDYTYNQGTCIGAGVMLYKETGDRKYLDDAKLAADYTKNKMCDANGILPAEGDWNEQGVLKSILAHYMSMLIKDGGQQQYLPWMQNNAGQAWRNRDKSRNLMFRNYRIPCPTGKIQSYEASSGVALLQLFGLPAPAKPNAQGEKTAFQVADGWHEDYDVRSDVAIVYGINDAGGRFEERVQSWREKGYNVHFMTGIAWGQYQDYFTGKFDGKTHWDEGQVQRNGDTIWHGRFVPYIVPSSSFLTYMKTHVKRAIDAGVSAIHLEEPEFWARAGYSESFKKEWQQYYGSPWRPQHESPEATYLSSKLKYQLYFNALKDVFTYIKEYSKSKGLDVKCYVPTHSLINYSSWQIVSPEASLAQLQGMDGYIAQVWTGTSREPVFYNGVKKERVFENAFLEYGSMVSMTAPTGRKIFFLTDPIEDWPRSWDDYKKNYQATFTAQLLYPSVADYEVMPWPPRIYRGRFRVEGKSERQPISKEYGTQMQVMVNALNDIPAVSNTVNGSKGIGVLVANSMMFQRFPTHASYSDPQLSNFYGMVLPLVKRGIPVETVHYENLENANTLKNIKVLVMSYSNMKPLSPKGHEQLAEWVKKGGVLIYYGRDDDPFQSVPEWWNQGNLSYKSPSEHLMQLLQVKPVAGQVVYAAGKGKFFLVRRDPKELVMTAGQDREYIDQVTEAYVRHAKMGNLVTKNYFLLHRGPYDIAAVLDENDIQSPLIVKGPVIDLFDPALPVLPEKTVNPGEQAFLYQLSRVKNNGKPKVLAAAARVYDEKIDAKQYSFVVKSPAKTVNVMRILLPAKPTTVKAGKNGTEISLSKNSWDSTSKTLLLEFDNYSEGVQVSITW